jgi:hypothetical protein
VIWAAILVLKFSRQFAKSIRAVRASICPQARELYLRAREFPGVNILFT